MLVMPIMLNNWLRQINYKSLHKKLILNNI
jgi:hypothetical protein